MKRKHIFVKLFQLTFTMTCFIFFLMLMRDGWEKFRHKTAHTGIVLIPSQVSSKLQTSNVKRQTSNVKRQTSNVKTSNVKTSNVKTSKRQNFFPAFHFALKRDSNGEDTFLTSQVFSKIRFLLKKSSTQHRFPNSKMSPDFPSRPPTT